MVLRTNQVHHTISIVNKIRYVDNALLIVNSVERLQTLGSVINKADEGKRFKINRKNTDLMVASKRSETRRRSFPYN